MVRVLIGAIIAPILMLVALTIFDPFNDGRRGAGAPSPARPPEPFRVQDGRIVVPKRWRRFVGEGRPRSPTGPSPVATAAASGRATTTAWGADFDRLKRVGVNTVRILVTPRPRDTRQLPRLRRFVALARERGLVVVIGPALTTFVAGGKLLRHTWHRRYRNDSAVWFLVMKDPNCSAARFRGQLPRLVAVAQAARPRSSRRSARRECGRRSWSTHRTTPRT